MKENKMYIETIDMDDWLSLKHLDKGYKNMEKTKKAVTEVSIIARLKLIEKMYYRTSLKAQRLEKVLQIAPKKLKEYYGSNVKFIAWNAYKKVWTIYNVIDNENRVSVQTNLTSKKEDVITKHPLVPISDLLYARISGMHDEAINRNSKVSSMFIKAIRSFCNLKSFNAEEVYLKIAINNRAYLLSINKEHSPAIIMDSTQKLVEVQV